MHAYTLQTYLVVAGGYLLVPGVVGGQGPQLVQVLFVCKDMGCPKDESYVQRNGCVEGEWSYVCMYEEIGVWRVRIWQSAHFFLSERVAIPLPLINHRSKEKQGPD